MHVVAELGHVRDRRVADPLLEPGELAPLPAGDVLEVGEVRVAQCEPRRGVAGLRAELERACPQQRPAPRRSTGVCTRLTTSASTANSPSASRCAKYSASSTASRRGDVTSTNAVSSAASSCITSAARSRKPSSMPSNARKKATTSSTGSVPTTREMVRRNACAATAAHAQRGTGRHHQEAEDAVVEQPGEPAGRVEEVERVPGRRRVDHDEVEPAAVVELVQLLHRHVLLRARERAGDVAVEAVLEDALRLLVVARVGQDELVERGLGVEHQRVQTPTRSGVAARDPRRRAGSRAESSRGARARGCWRAAWRGRW